MQGIMVQFVLPMVLFIAIFYFLLIRPQQKRTRETHEMQSSLNRGDKVITIGGLQGTIESIDDQNIVLKSSSSKLSFERGALRATIKKSGAPAAGESDEAKKSPSK